VTLPLLRIDLPELLTVRPENIRLTMPADGCC
jgi:hypothetical protein